MRRSILLVTGAVIGALLLFTSVRVLAGAVVVAPWASGDRGGERTARSAATPSIVPIRPRLPLPKTDRGAGQSRAGQEAALEAGPPRAIPGFGSGQLVKATAEILGTRPQALRSALHTGVSLSTVAAQRGVSRQTLIEGLTDRATARWEAKVAAGLRTQAEAEQALAILASQLPTLVDLPWSSGD